MPALHCTGRRDEVSTFHIFTLTGNLGGAWTPVRNRVPCRDVSNLQLLQTRANTEEHVFDLLIPVGLMQLTTRKTLCLLSPYCPILALNRVRFPEGKSTSRFPSQLGTLPGGLHTPSSAQRQHASIGIPAGTRRVIASNATARNHMQKMRHRVATNGLHHPPAIELS
jgi:hypothetical protein